MAALGRSQQTNLSSEKRDMVMRAAISLFHAAGGTADDLKGIVLQADDRKRRDIADAVAQMVVATAAVSHASDLDLVQAAYNWIDKRRSRSPARQIDFRKSFCSVSLAVFGNADYMGALVQRCDSRFRSPTALAAAMAAVDRHSHLCCRPPESSCRCFRR